MSEQYKVYPCKKFPDCPGHKYEISNAVFLNSNSASVVVKDPPPEKEPHKYGNAYFNLPMSKCPILQERRKKIIKKLFPEEDLVEIDKYDHNQEKIKLPIYGLLELVAEMLDKV